MLELVEFVIVIVCGASSEPTGVAGKTTFAGEMVNVGERAGLWLLAAVAETNRSDA